MAERKTSSSPMPFIVGTGRCGTTLLRVMLDSHPDLAIPPESHFFREIIKATQDGGDVRAEFMTAVTGSRNWDHFQVDPARLEDRVRGDEPFDVAEGIRAIYGLYAERFGKPRWGDKTPGYLASMRSIEELLPEAHFIHLVRDGRDVALSVLPQMDRSGERHTVEDGARWWVKRMLQGRSEAAGVTHYLELRYEDLVRSPETTLRDVCHFIDLPWNEAMLDYHQGARNRLAADRQSPASLLRLSRPPDSERIGRWRAEMTAEQLARVEEIAGDLLSEYGYD